MLHARNVDVETIAMIHTHTHKGSYLLSPLKMGSPPKRLQPLIESDKSSLCNYRISGLDMALKHATVKGRRTLGNLSSIRMDVHPAAYGPHQFISSNSKVNQEKLRRSRPLSSLRTLKNPCDEEVVDLFSIERKERKARATPYLKHMKQQQREEVLMELGSIVNTIDKELSLELQLQSMLGEIIGKPPKKKGRKYNSGMRLKKMKRLSSMGEITSDGDSLSSHHSSQLSSPYDIDALNEDDAGISSYTTLNFEASEDSDETVDQLIVNWGFGGVGIDPSSSSTENRMSELGIDQIISEFDSTQNYHDEFINISPKAGADEFSFGPDMVGSFTGQSGAPEDDYDQNRLYTIE